MIRRCHDYFLLETAHTSYFFRILKSGQLQHLYYGERLEIGEFTEQDDKQVLRQLEALVPKKEFVGGNQIAYSMETPKLGLEGTSLEISAYGKGDIREPFVELIFPDGSRTCDFIFTEAVMCEKKQPVPGLPAGYSENQEDCSQINLRLKDKNHEVILELRYVVYPGCDVITRSAVLENHSGEVVQIERLMSTQLDLPSSEWVVTSFHGAWAREMNRRTQQCTSGLFVNHSMAGCSSNRTNPFLMLGEKDTTEEFGDCYGFNLIYSGNHYEALETTEFNSSRFVSGINPRGFLWQLQPEESFYTPEAVMTYSKEGYTQLSHHMHEFVREHVVRGSWKKKERPILLNNWEATYFKFTEGKLLKLAQKAKELGVELFVMDDGWFGHREDDSSSLGDWYVNQSKLPNGLKGLADKINKMGLEFGIWVEPEMVSEDSDCYRNHPDWVFRIPGQEHSLGRNQMVLDLANPEVCDYIYQSMEQVFDSANITYVKWDMNRIFSDVYSPSLPPHQQGEAAHRYMLGLYDVLERLTKRFPQILFEGCASGGNRFDLGILSYMPQIWASDNTDSIERGTIQEGYSYGYPPSVWSSHVSSCPNHQLLRTTPLDTRYHMACFGILGYELNLGELSGKEQEAVKQEIATYKEWRNVCQFGDFYRMGKTGWFLSVSKDQTRAVCSTLQLHAQANTGEEILRLKGLAEDKNYHFYNIPGEIDIRIFGDLINTMAPVHIKKDSLVHQAIANYMKFQEPKEESWGKGCNFNKSGVKLHQAYTGTGYNEETRIFRDYDSRMYFLCEEQVPELKKEKSEILP